MNKKHLNLICADLDLGTPYDEVKRIYGGRGGHLMWHIKTMKGDFAIKQLTPDIELENDKTVARYELTETIASRFLRHGIMAVPAVEKSGKHLIIKDRVGYLIYPWIEGYTLNQDEISEYHALKIAEILAKIHKLNLNVPEITEPRVDTYSNDSITEAIERSVTLKYPFSKALKDNQNLILSMNENFSALVPLLKQDTVITHGDVDQQNVIWDRSDQPFLIDWEAIKKMNPTREIIRTARSWSGIGIEDSSSHIYINMLKTYVSSGGQLNQNHIDAALYAMFGNMLFWMMFNIAYINEGKVQEVKDNAINEINNSISSILKLKLSLPNLIKITKGI